MDMPEHFPPLPSDAKLLNLIGLRFHRLVVVGYAGSDGKNSLWWARCDCGAASRATSQKLRHGHTKSCGCLKAEQVGARRKVHGLTRTPEWNSWVSMRRRCLQPKDAAYTYYGGRGISICRRWLYGDAERSGFQCFLLDMGRRASADHSIDRIDNDGNYEPSNCRWATAKQQAQNRRPARARRQAACHGF